MERGAKRKRKYRGQQRQKARKYYRKNRSKLRRKSKQWYKRNKNKPRIKQQRKRYRKNPTRYRKYGSLEIDFDIAFLCGDGDDICVVTGIDADGNIKYVHDGETRTETVEEVLEKAHFFEEKQLDSIYAILDLFFGIDPFEIEDEDGGDELYDEEEEGAEEDENEDEEEPSKEASLRFKVAILVHNHPHLKQDILPLLRR